MPDVAIDRGGVWPVGLNGHNGESMSFDQPTGDRSARGIKFGRAMGRLSQQDDLRIAKTVEKCAKGRLRIRRG
jgi:hypothetical protein